MTIWEVSNLLSILTKALLKKRKLFIFFLLYFMYFQYTHMQSKFLDPGHIKRVVDGYLWDIL